MSGVTTYTNCLRIERTDGYVLCLTELDKDLIIDDAQLGLAAGNQTYLSAAGYTPTNMQSTSDNAVNNADVEGVLSSVGVQREDIIGGRYDFAKLHIFLWDYENDTMIKKLGSGHWGEVTVKDGSYVAEFRSLSQQLQQTIGRTFNPECDEQLGGTRCGVDLGPLTSSYTVTGASDNANFTVASIPGDANDFAYGKLTFTSGNNNGLHMEIKQSDANSIELQLPMPFDVEIGDTFDMYKGCDKRLSTCKDKFSNHINFQGFPLKYRWLYTVMYR